MTYDTYRLLHIVGLLCLFLGLGGLLAAGRPGEKAPRQYVILHALGLLIMLVAGFGIAAKREFGFPLWMIAKVGIWLVLGATPVLIRRGIVPRPIAWLVVLALGAAAAYLGTVVIKPF